MKSVKFLAGAALLVGVTACHPVPVPGDKSRDRGFHSHSVSNLKAGIWVDPNGCDHWIIDDGLEGYLSARLDPYGKPVCSGVHEPNTANGDFKRGVWDPSNG